MNTCNKIKKNGVQMLRGASLGADPDISDVLIEIYLKSCSG